MFVTNSSDSDASTNVCTYSLFSSSSQTTAIKLDRSNFLVWESIVLPLIEGNRLEGHINGQSRALTKLGMRNRENLKYLEWFAVDHLLVG